MLCPKCQYEIKEDVLRCPNCNRAIKLPANINIASIIQLFMGGFACIFGLMIMAEIRKPQNLEKAMSRLLEELSRRGRSFPLELNQGLIIKIAVFLGITMLIWGVVDIIVGLGLRNLKKWAGILAIISGVLGIIAGFGKDPVSFVINLTIIILIVSGWNSLS